MSISVLPLVPSPAPVARALARPAPDRARRLGRLGPPREPGLVALGLGLLALTSSVHPLWVVPAIGLAVAAIAVAVSALLRAGERRHGAIGALAALAIGSVTVPATFEGAGAVHAWIGSLRS